MNLFQIHQYRVTSLRSSAELHLGAGHGTRHDLFLPSLFPLRRPTRKVVSGSELLSSAWRLRKSVNLKTASPGLASPCSFERLSLSGCPVTGCRWFYTFLSRTSSLFLKKFSDFFAHFSQNIDNTTQKFCIFLHQKSIFSKICGFYARKAEIQTNGNI